MTAITPGIGKDMAAFKTEYGAITEWKSIFTD